MNDQRLLYSKPDAAKQLGISERVLDRLLNEGKVSKVTIGRRVLIAHDALEDYVARLVKAS